MEVSFTDETFEDYSNGKELADQRAFVSALVEDRYENDPHSTEATELAHAIADMKEIGDKFDDQDMEPSADNTPFEKLSYSTFRLERRFFDAQTVPRTAACGACALRGSVVLCNAAPCYPFESSDRWMNVFFAIIPVSRASSGKKEYVPDTPESFDFSPENWNSVKAFIGM